MTEREYIVNEGIAKILERLLTFGQDREESTEYVLSADAPNYQASLTKVPTESVSLIKKWKRIRSS